MRLTIGAITLVLGVLFLAGSGYLFFRTLRALAHRELHNGVVVESDRDLSDVVYDDEQGAQHTVHLDSGNANQFDLGTEIEIYVDPSDPEIGTPNRFANLYGLQTGLLAVAVLFLSIGGLVWAGKPALTGAFAFGFVSLASGTMGFFMLKDALLLQLTGTVLTGHVIDAKTRTVLERNDMRRSTGTRYVQRTRTTFTIQYDAPDGTQRTFHLVNPVPAIKTGQEVPIVVDFSHRRPVADLKGWKAFILWGTVIPAFCVVFAGIAVGFWLVDRGVLRP